MPDNSTSSVDWQPTETAPRDGARFLAFGSYAYPGDTKRTEYMEIAEYDPDSASRGYPWRDWEGAHLGNFFSHWTPLPKGPIDV